jgi:predicted outer membrane repeat protein
MRVLMLTAYLLSCPCFSALAETYVVFPDGSGDFPTIQSAIDAATDGDVIALTDGTFTGDGNRDIDYRGKAITVESQGGNPESCVIDCEGSETDPHCGVHFRKGEPVESVLAGVTVRGGWAVFPDFGGAVRCEGGSSPTIVSCVFLGNVGSAVGCEMGTFLPMSGCRFTENQGTYGGAIYADRSSLTLDHCRFIENEADHDGGAIFTYGTLAKIMHSEFIGNTSHSAAAASFHDASEGNVIECLFEGNVSSSSGGALTFWISGPNLVDRCTFVGNVAGHEGAALWSEKISTTYVRSCTFWGNASPDGTVLAGHQQFGMEKTIVAFSTEGPGVASYEGYAELSCCDIFGNAGGDWVGTIADQYGVNGNIGKDPLFCDPENGDFQLDAASPCAPFSPPNPECDLAGARPVGCGGTPVTLSTWGAIKALYGGGSSSR